jgi:hypothetical protein
MRGAHRQVPTSCTQRFQNSYLTGAKYDCATKLPEDIDPMAAGMINLDGSCPAP